MEIDLEQYSSALVGYADTLRDIAGRGDGAAGVATATLDVLKSMMVPEAREVFMNLKGSEAMTLGAVLAIRLYENLLTGIHRKYLEMAADDVSPGEVEIPWLKMQEVVRATTGCRIMHVLKLILQEQRAAEVENAQGEV